VKTRAVVAQVEAQTHEPAPLRGNGLVDGQ
jgi:hypothetical protein